METITLKNIENILKAIANKRRAQIFMLLAKRKQLPVYEISKLIKLSFRSTSKHLSQMYKAGILEREQKSLTVLYSVDHTHPAVKVLLQLFAHSRE
jgi:DNA-binding transcriptional ArsR family regulator